MDIDKWFRVNLEGCFYDDMVGKLVKEEACTTTLYFSKSIGTATFLKEKLTIEEIN